MIRFSSRVLSGIIVVAVLCGAQVLSSEPPRKGSAGRLAQDNAGGQHGEHGTPKEWKFSWPKGDPVKGREIFVKFECSSCHGVKGETFLAPNNKESVGPELSMT